MNEYSGTDFRLDTAFDPDAGNVSGNIEEQEEEPELPTQPALVNRGISIGVSSDKIQTSANNGTNESRLK